MIALTIYHLIALLTGFILGYFLNVYLVMVLFGLTVGFLLFLYFQARNYQSNGTSGGLIILFLMTFALVFLIGLFIGIAPILPWNKFFHWLNPAKAWEFVKTNILR